MGKLNRKKKIKEFKKEENFCFLSKTEKQKVSSVSLVQLFRYGSAFDFFLMFIGTFVAIFTGVGMPFLSIILGNISQSFINMTKLVNNENLTDFNYTPSKFSQDIQSRSLWSVYMGIGIFFSALIQVSCFLIASENIMRRLRKEFFKAILRQNIEWYDLNNSGTLATKLFDNLERVKEGVGDKVAFAIQYTAQFFAGFVIAFMYNVKLTLIMMTISPFMILGGILLAKVMARSIMNEVNHYATAGAIAEETLTSLRTVYAFNGQKYECERYDKALIKAKIGGIKKAIFIGGSYGFTHLIMFCSYCLAFWVGTNFVVDKSMDAQTLIITFFSIMMGSTALGQAGPQFAVIGTAQGAAASVYEVIDKKLTIDSYSDEGIKLSKTSGHITVSNLHFTYPSRSDIPVLNGITIEALPGETVALVGSSGCGKSTIISLLLRFYDATSGEIKLDGYNISDLNLKSLRKLIGVVTQEPILFDCSIEENIKFGNADEEVSYDEMKAACKMANADKFISDLPEGYKTLVGERGTQLSGGQKQRIAIARALIRNPKILLLDEATSALDSESESIVQEALDRAREGRTTIIIAHRLSTIQNANKIIAIKDGKIEEVGTHKDLMSKEGYYHKLVNSQVFVDTEVTRTATTKDGRTRTISRLSKSDPLSPCGITSNEEEKETKTIIKDPQTKLKKLQKALVDEGAKERSLFAILKFAKPEAFLILFGLIAAIIEGTIFPTFSVFFSNIMENFAGTDPDQMRKNGHFWAMGFLLLGLILSGSIFIEASLFGLMAERITMRIRSKLFRNILRQDVAYFDSPNHSSGKLCTRLASDIPNIRMAIDCRLSAVFSSTISMATGIFIAFYFNWQMALLVVTIFPLVGLCEKFQLDYAQGKAIKDARDMENAGKVAFEAIENIRSVQALTLERHFYSEFKKHLEFPHQTSIKKSIIQGLTYAFSTSLFFFLYAAAFRFGGWLIVEKYQTANEISPMNVLRTLYAISFTAGSMGFASTFFPAYIKAKIAAGLIFKMLEDKPIIDNSSNDGLEAKNIQGHVHFKNIDFFYPQRSEAKVLHGINIEAAPGQTIALVGSSGCGKSTCVSLLERFYEPSKGEILIDGKNIKEYGLQGIRSQISLVSQEPLLFDKSIKENIFYGLNEDEKSEEAMIEVSILANIHNFVISLPEQYETRVGEKGTQLSGGQKQRIAIARALIRNPKILLLDEATSALDSESEFIVQEALDRAREGRTCIVIAHRLSTIVNADRIIVISNGKIVEEGTHSELLAMKRVYFSLTQKQNKKQL